MFSKLKIHRKLIQLPAIILVYFIIISVNYSFTKYILFNYNVNTNTYQQSSFSLLFILVISIFYISSFMTIITHTKAMLTNPGEVNQIKFNSEIHKTKKESFCNKCNHQRPFRAKHCSKCNKCILKFDHHCPWIANCVGLYNQKIFFQFLFWGTLGDLIAFICLINRLFDMGISVPHRKSVNDSLYLVLFDKIMLIVSSGLSLGMVVGIGYLLYVQFDLITSNITYIESLQYSCSEENYLYDLNKLNSWKIVMGENIIEWILPIIKINECNNGYYYGKYEEMKSMFKEKEIPEVNEKGNWNNVNKVSMDSTELGLDS